MNSDFEQDHPDSNHLDATMWACLDDIERLAPAESVNSVSSRVAELDRAARISVLVGILSEEIGYDCFWPIFLEWWPDFEFPHRWENLADILRDLHRTNPAYDFLLPADKAFFDSLPELITAHRGASVNFPLGVSWTTDKDKAQWFARRFDPSGGSVVSKTICKRDVWAVFTHRKESEILCDPLAMRDV
jgi:hypothetical protein